MTRLFLICNNDKKRGEGVTLKKDIDWRSELKDNITSAEELVAEGYAESSMLDELKVLIDKYPMSIPRYYLNLIENKDYSDPIYKMCVASLQEGLSGGSEDTSGEGDNTVSDGVQHKYENTVLVLSTNVCAMYCRHCFRKRMVGQSEDEVLKFTDQAIEYISTHPEVDNVLISGGDSLLNSNKVIQRYLEGLSSLPHIKFIRFGSRTPVVFPQRIYGDSELMSLFEKYSKRKTIYLVTQFNHPRELTKESLMATDMLRFAGVPVLNQTVLLKGVNDNVETLVDLFNGLTANGISPYYLFQCRPVRGVKDLFSVPLLSAVDIVDETRAKLSGVAKRFRFAMSHIIGKMEIIGKTQDNRLILKQHQAKGQSDINKLFTTKVSQHSTWLPAEFSCELL